MLGQMARPLRRPGLEVGHEAALVVLRATDGRLLWVLNESALALWQLCDGETSRDEMVDAICALCGITRERAGADVDRTLTSFTSARLISWCDVL